ncbi:hypothetical protein BGX34_008344, partial [Mortierella sp. NVP85]
MITYLEGIIRVNNGGKDPSDWELDSSELSQLKSYLEAEKDEDVFGNLCHTITRDWQSVWVCSKHRREYHQSALRQIKEIIMENDEEFVEDQGKVTVKIRSDMLTKWFLEALSTIHWIRGFDKHLAFLG